MQNCKWAVIFFLSAWTLKLAAEKSHRVYFFDEKRPDLPLEIGKQGAHSKSVKGAFIKDPSFIESRAHKEPLEIQKKGRDIVKIEKIVSNQKKNSDALNRLDLRLDHRFELPHLERLDRPFLLEYSQIK